MEENIWKYEGSNQLNIGGLRKLYQKIPSLKVNKIARYLGL